MPVWFIFNIVNFKSYIHTSILDNGHTCIIVAGKVFEHRMSRQIHPLHVIIIHFFRRPTNGRAGNENMRSALIVSNGTPCATCVCAYLICYSGRLGCFDYFYRNILDLINYGFIIYKIVYELVMYNLLKMSLSASTPARVP